MKQQPIPELTISGSANAVRNVWPFWPKLAFLVVSLAIGFGAGCFFGVNNADAVRALLREKQAVVPPAEPDVITLPAEPGTVTFPASSDPDAGPGGTTPCPLSRTAESSKRTDGG